MPCIRSSCNFLHSSSSSFSCLLNSGELDGSFSRLNWHSLSSLGTAQCKLNSLPLGVTKGTEAYVSGFGMETTDSSTPTIYLNDLHLQHSGPGLWKLLIWIIAPFKESFSFCHPWLQLSILGTGLCHAQPLHP